ncbi:hypothetical protein PFAG_02908 [Plasmodium falciparum Santa Lucia]|uniref:Uncharacterized protein n=8 Tax=Plasmodium falciparum TaxID=5833 RepID=A0A024W6W6_PLAFA|nr:hypothetical protein PFFVO_02918 [Plasmodium falciparum Vietnam Oak-Knoll (FVO)]ETW36318.1 hypothetical protein PFTANZ_02983 [Plasmodium falciparum Tanzania (2000708)]ETW42408.1 hypothetical protein PFNF135_03070 [Plasmodium falciparum NF135/5.C10]ETW49042.1 hypothetical protein PFMALIP_02922 [Plasmodium falciparum MaliPS096_E11]ETW61218.1 hypothetical protein PFMC_02905 [Plasmodium falciparum CAMP/Malaysia]EUR71973.1 hypothetical protein PFBG_02999 [Plasmodium falciparum 7G8]EUT85547.1 hy
MFFCLNNVKTKLLKIDKIKTLLLHHSSYFKFINIQIFSIKSFVLVTNFFNKTFLYFNLIRYFHDL